MRQVFFQTEDLHFLGRFGAGPDVAEVVELATLGRPGAGERVVALVEVRFAQKRRDYGHDQNQDQPRTERHHSGPEQQQRKDVLNLRKYLREQYSAAGGLTPGAFELVVENGILELVQIQLCRVVDQIHGGFIGHQIAQQTIAQANQPTQ